MKNAIQALLIVLGGLTTLALLVPLCILALDWLVNIYVSLYLCKVLPFINLC